MPSKKKKKQKSDSLNVASDTFLKKQSKILQGKFQNTKKLNQQRETLEDSNSKTYSIVLAFKISGITLPKQNLQYLFLFFRLSPEQMLRSLGVNCSIFSDSFPWKLKGITLVTAATIYNDSPFLFL